MSATAKRSDTFRSRVLALLRKSPCPLSAYDVLAEFQVANPKIAPPTVYRALNALIEQGDVHKLESKKAYVACQCEAHQQPAIMAICNDCGAVEERVAPELVETLSALTESSGFAPSHHVIEIQGRCHSCEDTECST